MNLKNRKMNINEKIHKFFNSNIKKVECENIFIPNNDKKLKVIKSDFKRDLNLTDTFKHILNESKKIKGF